MRKQLGTFAVRDDRGVRGTVYEWGEFQDLSDMASAGAELHEVARYMTLGPHGPHVTETDVPGQLLVAGSAPTRTLYRQK